MPVERRGRTAWKWAPRHGGEIARRGRSLAAAGVRTPELTWHPRRLLLAARWIDGPSGRTVAATSIDDVLAGAARTLVDLHRLDPRDVDDSLGELDRGRHIRRRLATAAPSVRSVVSEWLRGRDRGPGPGSRRGLVHGDCHVGQFVFAPPHAPWLVDLDDLAIGPPEHDVGNLLAHLATSHPTEAPELADVLAWIRPFAARGPGMSSEAIRDHLGVALVRRALKLDERGDGDRADRAVALASTALSSAGS